MQMGALLKLVPLEKSLVEPLANYWSNLSDGQLTTMGVDANKLPSKKQFTNKIIQQLNTPIEEKITFALLAILNGKAIGHCNLNPISYDNTAKMHLHIWNKNNRKKGLGYEMIQKALPIFFDTFQLKEIICEPKASNIAPNKTLQKVGFRFLKKYRTIPGDINFEQEVNQWKLTVDVFSGT